MTASPRLRRTLAFLLLFSNTVSASTTLTDRYGEPLRTRLPGENVWRQDIPLENVSPWMILATLAAEDKRFFSHSGVDLSAVARALWQNTRNGRVVSGGSTVTQQLVRLIEPHPKTVRGKIKESVKALWMERRLSKYRILEAYLNESPYGGRVVGIEAASQAYFGVPARDLSLSQAALLAGIPQSPVRYDPIRRFSNAQIRQKNVLERMKTWGWLTPEAYTLALRERLQVNPLRNPWTAPHFTDHARRSITGEQASVSTIRTTLDAGLQRSLEGLVRTHLARLEKSRVTNAALVAIDNRTGDVLAWVGSAGFDDETIQGQVDGVTARRQPGSALKPFLYGLAFSEGLTPADLLRDEPVNLNGYMPKNYDETFHGPVRAREALACSFNVPAVLLGARVGVAHFLETLHAFGFDSLDQPAERYGYGLALGNGEVTLLEAVQAYAALARGGVWIPARLFPSEEDPVGRRVLSRQSSYLVTSILSDNAARAHAFGLNSPFHLSFPFAAKTGTTKDYRDNWAIGYTPDWTLGVWVGNFDGKPMRRVSGISGAAPLLRDAALTMEKRLGSRPFERPRGVQEVAVCPLSGQLPRWGCPTAIQEVFAHPFLPKATCSLHNEAAASAPSTSASAQIEFPAAGDLFKVNPRAPRDSQALLLRSNLPEKTGGVRWIMDRRELPVRGPNVWWRLEPGSHELHFIAEVQGRTVRSRPISFRVVP